MGFQFFYRRSVEVNRSLTFIQSILLVDCCASGIVLVPTRFLLHISDLLSIINPTYSRTDHNTLHSKNILKTTVQYQIGQFTKGKVDITFARSPTNLVLGCEELWLINISNIQLCSVPNKKSIHHHPILMYGLNLQNRVFWFEYHHFQKWS